jgi:hypothetical protein
MQTDANARWEEYCLCSNKGVIRRQYAQGAVVCTSIDIILGKKNPPESIYSGTQINYINGARPFVVVTDSLFCS